jgi:hypothetical protein
MFVYLVKLINMKAIEQSKLYGEYYINQLALKHKFIVVDLDRFLVKPFSKEDAKLSPYHGYGKPNKEVHRICFYYLWADIKILTFEEFIKTYKHE